MTAPAPRSDGERAVSPLRQPMAKPRVKGERDALLPSERSRDLELQQPSVIGEHAPGAAAQELSTLLELVYPVVLTSALEFLPGFTCIILTGHIDSPYTKQYVDAATLSTMFTNISAYSIGFGLTSALDTLCSQAYGARRLDKIGIYFQSGVLIIAACMVPIFFLNWYSSSFLLMLGQDPEVSKLAEEFSRLVLLGVPFVFAYELVRKALQAQNIMAPLVVIAVIGNAVTIALGYWLTYHTTMGFYGIALARALGNVIMPFLLIPYFHYHPTHLSQWWCDGWNIGAALDHIGLFLRLGVPGMLMMIMEWWAYEVLSLLAGILPDDIVAMSAHAVLLNVSSLVYMVFAGLSSAANIRVGNCLGANEPRQAQLASSVALMLTLGMSLTLAAGLYLTRGYIPFLFVGDPETAELAARALQLWAPFEVLDGLNCVIQGVFRGAGKQKVAATTNAIAYYGAGIPVAAFVAFSEGMGIEGLWLGFGLGIFCSFAILFYRLNRKWRWRELALDAMERTAE